MFYLRTAYLKVSIVEVEYDRTYSQSYDKNISYPNNGNYRLYTVYSKKYVFDYFFVKTLVHDDFYF